MSEDDDLPDTDYESIYGAEMLEARKQRRWREIFTLLDDLRRQNAAALARASAMAEEVKGWRRPGG